MDSSQWCIYCCVGECMHLYPPSFTVTITVSPFAMCVCVTNTCAYKVNFLTFSMSHCLSVHTPDGDTDNQYKYVDGTAVYRRCRHHRFLLRILLYCSICFFFTTVCTSTTSLFARIIYLVTPLLFKLPVYLNCYPS
ncbi:hypothetical protein BDF19DRAFT_12023 [Syncephalis fuscata]|nr:hypothetical protein BDF19DRAFT_12023 [Syncephalis fuscata]